MHDEQEDAEQIEWCRQWSEEHKKKIARKMQKKIKKVSVLVQFQNLSEICLV